MRSVEERHKSSSNSSGGKSIEPVGNFDALGHVKRLAVENKAPVRCLAVILKRIYLAHKVERYIFLIRSILLRLRDGRGVTSRPCTFVYNRHKSSLEDKSPIKLGFSYATA